jgi:predicted metal-dependent phosphotriesterase family hydrolase
VSALRSGNVASGEGIRDDVVHGIARRDNRVMALGVATVVVGTLIGRYVRGPTESATHLYLVILATSGYGKDWPYQAGEKVMDVLGKADLVGPGEWASAPGFIKALVKHPLMLCFMDELGDEISLVNSQNQNRFVSKIIGLLKKTYNA